MAVPKSTGYGPRFARLIFNGEAEKYETWEVKFLGHLKLQGLKETILPSGGGPDAC